MHFIVLSKKIGHAVITAMMFTSMATNTNMDLVNQLRSSGILKSRPAIDAFTKVDRGKFCKTTPYEDSPAYLMAGQTISAPHMHASAVEYLLPSLLKENAQVLDIGCGSGYLTVLMARLNKGSKVFGIDIVPELVELSKQNTRAHDKDLMESGRVSFTLADGWKGYPEHAPFDAIHVGAAAEMLPKELVKQLKVGGTMFIPVGQQSFMGQVILLLTRTKDSGPLEEQFDSEELMPVRYVPLVRGKEL